MASSQRPRKTKNRPASPDTTNAVVPCSRTQGEKIRNPNANPANANATQGNAGKSQGCGVPKLCTPLIYDSRYNAIQRGWCVVQRGGVTSTMSAPATIAKVT